jgi:alcohol dehydrogenase, propanol-preferring
MTGTMRAALLTGPGQPLRIETMPIPVLRPGQVLVRLEACGICHTDVHIWQNGTGSAHAPQPLIMGHEGVGRIAAVAADVERVAVGDRVGVPWLAETCGQCDECLGGAESFCQAHKAHGYDIQGAFAEYVAVDARFAVRLAPDIDPLSTAPLMCAGVTAYGAIRRAEIRLGMRAAIFGCGGLGLYAVQLAVRAGAEVIAIDVSAAKLARAQALGAHRTMLAGPETGAALAALGGMQACINFAPTPSTWSTMIEGIRPRGRIVAAALVSEPVPIRQDWLTATGVIITGTSVGTRLEMAALMRLHAVQPLQSEIEVVALDGVTDALQRLAGGQIAGRAVIRYG